MRKFLVVGCGGSGGTTLRLMIDQLKADLRAQGVNQLPAAWQFVHVDARVGRDRGPAPLGDIIDLGGSYVSVTHATNTYGATAQNVENTLGQAGGVDGTDFAPLLGWIPRDVAAANGIPVTNGAGQYRAIGRMLTLPHLRDVRKALEQAQARMMAPDAWGALQGAGQDDPPTAIVVASMAGGSGASMFLDVCRTLGTISGIDPASIGCFLYTADVFAELSPDQRANVEGNAMAAVTEAIAAATLGSEAFDRQTLERFGLPTGSQTIKPFGRIFPVGRRVGGGGAVFGDGSAVGVYRGVARALAGLLVSSKATSDYIDFFVGNPTPVPTNNSRFGWRASDRDLPFGSLGYASLSLGRERYIDYAAQRMSRSVVDHLLEGHMDPTSTMPSTEVLAKLLDNQAVTSLRAMGLPVPGQPTNTWFSSAAYPQLQWQASAREALGSATTTVQNVGAAGASSWLNSVRRQLQAVQPIVLQSLQRSAYAWAESWATQLETGTRAEFLRCVATFGLPYARELMARCRAVCDTAVSELSSAGQQARSFDPLAIESSVSDQATALGNQSVGATHALGQMLISSLQGATERRLRLEAAGYAAEVLRSYAVSVLGALESAANEAVRALEYSKSVPGGGAGLAQLHSSVYGDWPREDDVVPQRFDHAMNEVLLTTSADFPARYSADVAASGGAGAVFTQGLAALRSQIVRGEWETIGAVTEYRVVEQAGHWRAPVLTVSAADGTPTPQAEPRYSLALSADDIITRAHARMASPGDVFATFAGQTISSYLTDPAVSSTDRVQRGLELARKFGEAMAMARPVVGIDPPMVMAIHGSGLQYTYSFSEIPFGANDPVAQVIVAHLQSDPHLSQQTLGSFTRACSTNAADVASVRKINFFGSHPKYSSLCFTSVLSPVKDRWSSSTTDYQGQLWLWKRTRPLHASIAMSPEEAVKVTAGWFLGRILGLVRQEHDNAPEVCSTKGWLQLGPMLRSPEVGLRDKRDVLPNIFMAHAWAVVRCAGDPSLSPLAPYEALRHLIDTTGSNAQPPYVPSLAGTSLLAQALRGEPLRLLGMAGPGSEDPLQGDRLMTSLAKAAGAGAPAAPPAAPPAPAVPAWMEAAPPPAPAPEAQQDPSATIAARRDAILQYLEQGRNDFLKSGYVKQRGGDYVSHVTRVESLRSAPLWAETAPLALRGLDLLHQMTLAAYDQATQECSERHDNPTPPDVWS